MQKNNNNESKRQQRNRNQKWHMSTRPTNNSPPNKKKHIEKSHQHFVPLFAVDFVHRLSLLALIAAYPKWTAHEYIWQFPWFKKVRCVIYGINYKLLPRITIDNTHTHTLRNTEGSFRLILIKQNAVFPFRLKFHPESTCSNRKSSMNCKRFTNQFTNWIIEFDMTNLGPSRGKNFFPIDILKLNE